MLQLFTPLSPTGKYTTIGPLILVLSVTALKEGLEDYGRHKQDKEVNDRKTLILRKVDPSAPPPKVKKKKKK